MTTILSRKEKQKRSLRKTIEKANGPRSKDDYDDHVFVDFYGCVQSPSVRAFNILTNVNVAKQTVNRLKWFSQLTSLNVQ